MTRKRKNSSDNMDGDCGASVIRVRKEERYKFGKLCSGDGIHISEPTGRR